MKLIPNYTAIATKSYSMWMFYVSILCFFAPEVIYLSWGVDTNPIVWAVAGICFAVLGAVGRIVDQGLGQ